MTSPSRGYWVDGVELVNCGGDRCAACDRPAVGRSISGHLVCKTHAGWARREADELAAEVEAGKERLAKRRDEDAPRVRAALARLGDHRDAESATPVLNARGRTIAKAREKRRRGAAKVNAANAERQRLVREAAIIGVLEREGCPCSARAISTLSGLSLATVKRGLSELTLVKRVSAKRDRGAMTFFYSLRADSRSVSTNPILPVHPRTERMPG